ncbi:MAG: 6-bladed beta-propeller [Longimicrobiales bacterium]
MRQKHCVLAIVACMVAGCGQEPGMDAGAVDIDILPQWTLIKEQRIGRLNDPDSGFTRVSAVAEGASGKLYVLDAEERQVRVFDPDGKMIRAMGRAGSGPGEFDLPVDLELKGDTLCVTDIGERKLTLFRTDGTLLGVVPARGVQIKVGKPAVPITIAPRRLRSDGRFDSAFRIASRRVAVPDSLLVPELLFDSRGEVTDTVGWRMFYPDVWPQVALQAGTVFLTNIPDRGRPLYAADDRRRIIVERKPALDGSPYYVRLILQDGDSSEHRFYYRPHRAIEKQKVVSEIVESSGLLSRGMSGSEARQTVERLVAVPEYQPPITRVLMGADQSIWLHRETWRSGDTETFERWIVLDSEARPLAQLVLPPKTRLRWASRSHIWVVEGDDLGIPWVVRYRLAA